MLYLASFAAADCAASDASLFKSRALICSSLVQGDTWWCGSDWRNASGSKDWPSQAVYQNELLVKLASPNTCLNTSYANNITNWLNTSQANSSVSGTLMWTWLVFQEQYYNTPRKPGDRIEAPDTLGRKCWAFAYLAQEWATLAAPLQRAISAAGLDISAFVSDYERAIPETFALCHKVMHNCFQNATYVPGLRNGTCPLKIKVPLA